MIILYYIIILFYNFYKHFIYSFWLSHLWNKRDVTFIMCHVLNVFIYFPFHSHVAYFPFLRHEYNFVEYRPYYYTVPVYDDVLQPETPDVQEPCVR